MAGGNRNLIQNNHIYDNWRRGCCSSGPGLAAQRPGSRPPAGHLQRQSLHRQRDGPGAGRFAPAQRPGVPLGQPRRRQLLERNTSMSGATHPNTPVLLPDCPGSPVVAPSDPAVLGPLAPCAAWDPHKDPQPVGWIGSPPRPARVEPLRGGGGSGVLALTLGGCGSAHPSAPLRWQGALQAFNPADLPHDRVMLARVRNVSSRPVRLVASRVVVRDSRGRVLKSSARFIASYAHGLYGAFQQPSTLPPQELSRLGEVITLPARAAAPLALAWRVLDDNATAAATLDYGSGRLSLPTSVRPAAR